MTALENWFSRWVVHYRWMIVIASLLAVATISLGARNLHFTISGLLRKQAAGMRVGLHEEFLIPTYVALALISCRDDTQSALGQGLFQPAKGHLQIVGLRSRHGYCRCS